MIKKWATVVSWQNGVAILHSERKTACNRCSARKGCGSGHLNALYSNDNHIKMMSRVPLLPGQRVEIGIKEASLLVSALLVYMMPLVGLFILAGLFQWLFYSDAAAAVGAFLGGSGGVIIAKGILACLDERKTFQAFILNVSLPAKSLQIEKEN